METFGEGRLAFRFGNQKINVHVRGHEFQPHANLPAPGALDLCFIASVPRILAWKNQLRRLRVRDERRDNVYFGVLLFGYCTMLLR